MKAGVLLILLFTLSACGSKVRTSVCHDKFEKPPKSYWGDYEVVEDRTFKAYFRSGLDVAIG